MRSSAPTTPALLLLILPFAGMIAVSPGCGSTVIQATGSSAAGGDGVGGAGAGAGLPSASSGPASASSGPAASASSGGAGGSATCSAAEKVCGGKCVDADDPAYGCTPTGCAPCATQYPNALQACVAGACALGTCATGFENCDGDPANGCEVDTNDDPSNCGACGAPCAVAHATPSCEMGTCAIATCDSGWTDCDDDPTDGCEANLQNDPMNCGACGTACPGQVQCVIGLCGGYCDAKYFASCPGDPPGVCTQLGTNLNCSFCGDTCDLANATSECQPNATPDPFFVCALQMCNAGFADCDMVAANGCEADTQNDWNNCGGCGQECSGGPPGPNVAPPCQGGVCIGFECVMGYADCNNDPTDGCEADLATDPNNCHFCGNKCATTCSGGVCAP